MSKATPDNAAQLPEAGQATSFSSLLAASGLAICAHVGVEPIRLSDPETRRLHGQAVQQAD